MVKMDPNPRPPPHWQYALVLVGLWCMALAAALPYSIFVKLVYDDLICGAFCDERWPSSRWQRAYSTLTMAAQFLLPLIVQAYCYGQLAIQVIPTQI